MITFKDYFEYKGDKVNLILDKKVKSESKKYIVNDGDIIEFFYHKN